MNFVVHDQVFFAHAFGCAAAKQGKFLEFKNTWWEKSYGAKDMSVDNLLKWSSDIGLDVNKLKADAEGDCRERVQSDMTELRKFHVNGTPGFFVNGSFVGGMSKDDFQKLINAKLKLAEDYKGPPGEYYAQEIYGKGTKVFKGQRRRQR